MRAAAQVPERRPAAAAGGQRPAARNLRRGRLADRAWVPRPPGLVAALRGAGAASASRAAPARSARRSSPGRAASSARSEGRRPSVARSRRSSPSRRCPGAHHHLRRGAAPSRRVRTIRRAPRAVRRSGLRGGRCAACRARACARSRCGACARSSPSARPSRNRCREGLRAGHRVRPIPWPDWRRT